MGSGKSSILDAITYALFGTLPLVQTRRIKLDDLIMNRPRPMDSAEIEVGFIAPDGNEYVVKRAIERGKGTTLSELRKATGELIESPSSTRVSEVIGSLLKLDYDLFERAIYSEQNRLDYFLTLRRGERMESIDELLGIHKLERARKNMTKLRNRVQDRIDDRRAMVEQIGQDASLAALPALEQELKDLEAIRQGIKIELERLQPKLDSTRVELQKLRDLEQKITQFEKAVRGLEEAISTFEQQLTQVKNRLGAAVKIESIELQRRVINLRQAHEDARKNADDLDAKLTACTSLHRELTTKIEMMRTRLEKLVNEIARKHKSREQLERLKLPELTARVKQLEGEFQTAANELAACRARAQDLRQALAELTAAGSTCPVCESPLPEDKKRLLVHQRERQISTHQELLSQLETRLNKLDADLREARELQRRAELLTKEIENLPALENERSQLEIELKNLDTKSTETRAEMEKLRSDYERARQEVEKQRSELTVAEQQLQLRLDLDRLEAEYKRKLADRLRVQRELWQLRQKYDKNKAQALERRYEELIRTHEHLKTEFEGKEQIAAEKKKLIDSIREKRDLLRRCEEEIKQLHHASEALQMIQTAMLQSQTALRRHFIEAVNETMNEIWQEIYPYADFTGIRLAVEAGEKGSDYVLQVCDRVGNWIPVEGIVSGGERTCACLALRIAFSIVLAPALSWLVLDEPTHNLDAEGIRELAVALRERIPEIVEQVLLITHEERLEAAVSGYLYRFTRDKSTDQPTKIVQVAVPEE
jgi:exonuclease SbcC